MKSFCFTIDDNIRFLKEITEGGLRSIFDHPYAAMLSRLHERYNLKIQLNLFYRSGDFTLQDMSDKFRDEWARASDWLKLSFHSYEESPLPYKSASYEEVRRDIDRVNLEILRFAGASSLAPTTTLHYCAARADGVRALRDVGVRGLLGLYGSEASPESSYSLPESIASRLRGEEIIDVDGISHAAIDLIINKLPMDRIEAALSPLLSRESIRIMIHEQYFYPDYHAYQPDFEAKLALAFSILTRAGYSSRFFEEIL